MSRVWGVHVHIDHTDIGHQAEAARPLGWVWKFPWCGSLDLWPVANPPCISLPRNVNPGVLGYQTGPAVWLRGSECSPHQNPNPELGTPRLVTCVLSMGTPCLASCVLGLGTPCLVTCVLGLGTPRLATCVLRLLGPLWRTCHAAQAIGFVLCPASRIQVSGDIGNVLQPTCGAPNTLLGTDGKSAESRQT